MMVFVGLDMKKILKFLASGINHLKHFPDSIHVCRHFLVGELYVLVKMHAVLHHIQVELQWVRIVMLLELGIWKILALGEANHCHHETFQAYVSKHRSQVHRLFTCCQQISICVRGADILNHLIASKAL